MTRRFFILLSAGWLLSLPAAHASTEVAAAKLRTAVNEVLAVANKAPSRDAFTKSLGPVLDKHISFETMTKRAVGPGWRTFSEAQKQEATRLLSALIIRTYGAKFVPGEQPDITYSPATTPAAGRVDVPTRMVYRGSRYTVHYRLEAEVGWRVTDVVIEGVSLVANYRGQLDAQFKKGGAAAVLQSLTQSLAKSS